MTRATVPRYVVRVVSHVGSVNARETSPNKIGGRQEQICLVGEKLADRIPSSNADCHYSYTAKLGKPKGSRNKKTLEKLGLLSSKADGSTAAKTKAKANSALTITHRSTRHERKGTRPDHQSHEHDDADRRLSSLPSTETAHLELTTNSGSTLLPSPFPLYDMSPPPAGDLEVPYFPFLEDFDFSVFSPIVEGQAVTHVSAYLPALPCLSDMNTALILCLAGFHQFTVRGSFLGGISLSDK